MSVIYFNGSAEDEQARGSTIDSSKMEMYALREDKPAEMIYMGGHFFEDAPTYNLTEAKLVVVRKHVNGVNIVEEQQITDEYVKSITFNLMLPQKSISVTDRIFQSQKNCNYDVVFVPDDCVNSCDSFFMVGRKMNLGVKQLTSSIVGFDENGAPITNMRTMRTTGNLVTYHGLDGKSQVDADELHSALVVEQRCESCDCPYQKLVVGGVEILKHSEDSGNTYNPYTITAITAVMTAPAVPVFTGLALVGDNLVFSFIDSPTTPLEGGLGYLSYSGSGAAVVSTLDGSATGTASDLFLGVIVAFGKVFAFGEDIIAVSCDNGVSYTTIADATILGGDVIRRAVYDAGSGKIVFVGEDLAVYTYDGNNFESFSGTTFFPDLGATVDFTSVAVGSAGHVYLGTSTGRVYEHNNFSNFSTDDLFTLVSADTGATSIPYISADKNNMRVVWAETGNDVIKSRDPLNKMTPYVIYEHGETILNGAFGRELLDEGSNYFLFVGDGIIVTVATCGLCLDSGC